MLNKFLLINQDAHSLREPHEIDYCIGPISRMRAQKIKVVKIARLWVTIVELEVGIEVIMEVE
jgi:hypothetical protein